MKEIDYSHADAGAHTRTKLFVLIACEESQAECKAFRNLGHIAFSCDIQPCIKSGCPDWHILGDVSPYLEGVTQFVTQSGISVQLPKWDLIIAHPPCTYLCKVSSVRLVNRSSNKCPGDNWHWSQNLNAWVNGERWAKMKKARDFFYKCMQAKAHYVAVENPLPMAAAQLPKASTFIQPSWFGVKYTKKTLYWLKNLPPIMPRIEHPNPSEFVRSSRGKYRSRTFPEVAETLALQWSAYILDELNQNSNYGTE